MPDRTYNEDEVREILRRAVEASPAVGGGLTRDELVAAARDVGIDAEAVDKAIGTLDWDREIAAEELTLRRNDRRRLISSALTFAIILAALVTLHLLSVTSLWFTWPMGIWAIFLSLRAKGVLFDGPESTRKRAAHNVQQRRRQHELREAREARRPAATTAERGASATSARDGTARANRVRAPEPIDLAPESGSSKGETQELAGKGRQQT